MARLIKTLALLGFALCVISAPASTIGAEPETAATQATGHDSSGVHEEVGVIPTLKQAVIPALTTLGVFIVVLVIFGKLVWPKIASGLDDRYEKIRSEIASAELAKKEATEAPEQYQSSLADAKAEAQKLYEQTKADQKEYAAELRSKSEAEISQMRDKARLDIDAARRAAVLDVHTHAVALASNMAGKILQREISAQDQQRLVEESLTELQGIANG